MHEWEYAGAKWWKFDFHTHTPASDDFSPRDLSPESWLRSFMEEGIHCVAITDHHSGEWINRLKEKQQELAETSPPWYRPLYLFPGVEISANGNVHVLALFGRNRDESDIDRLLGAVGYSGTKGKSDAVTKKSVTEVINVIVEQGGIPIPAHADGAKGLFKIKGLTLEQALNNPNVYAIELRDSSTEKPPMYASKKLAWTEIQGSDSHCFTSDAFGTFTWIKMDKPSIDGLKLALIDGPVSVNRDMLIDPNRHAPFFLEELNIFNAKHIGRSSPRKFHFSPFLNAIIGGRGSGKSTLLEFMRLALDRINEIPDSLQKETRQYVDVNVDGSLLIGDSKISLIYRKGEVRYRLNWSAKADCSILEVMKNGNWHPCAGEVESLFPVRIYSQKQILEIAKNSGALLGIIDKASEVHSRLHTTRHTELVNRYKQIDVKQRELNEKISQENRLRGESNDLATQIEQIEKSGHQKIMQIYSKRSQQLNEIEGLENTWAEMSRRLGALPDEIIPAPFNKLHFSDHTDILSILETTNERWQEIRDRLCTLARDAQVIIADWHAEKHAADWMQRLNLDMDQYRSLSTKLEQQNIDPREYPRLLTQQKSIQTELNHMGEYRVRRDELGMGKREVLNQIEENWKAQSGKRQDFLTDILQDNQSVSIEVKPFGESWDGVENSIRDILQCPHHFHKDFEVLRAIYEANDDLRIENIKERIERILTGKEEASHATFAKHLKKLPQESVTDLILWFPKDDLKVTFGPKNRPIEQGSPGQKTAALLAFILSYGDEPLLLDQPEDDLDNKLIYGLVVEQLRDAKGERQVIVVTHNANIVVNGNAEMVIPLEVGGGETHVRHAASIQEKEVRDAICDILEGGQKAFEDRYKRIHLGD